MKEDKL